MEIEEWEKVINFLEKKDIKVVILWWEREKWFTKGLEKAWIYPKISDVLGKTNLWQLIYILEHSILNISGNGGVMWLANLVNQKNINIHTVSAFLMEPPVDNINSHNIRPYRYPCCKPCEAAISTIDGEKIIPWCLFKNTTREGECRKAITWENIIKLIEKIGI